MHIFNTPVINTEFYVLDETESKHCVKVLRLKEGNVITLIDGQGGFYSAEIVDAQAKRCKVKITEKQENFEKRKYRLTIGIAPTKNIGRFETFLEKATEIGIDEIIPLKTKNSERTSINSDRLKKVIIAAAKQSIKAFIPEIREIMTFNNIIKQDFDGLKLIAHCYESEKRNLIEELKDMQNALILIGPEGDFTSEEVEQAKKEGYREISLSQSRLRTETAGIVACDTFNLAEMIWKEK